MPLSLVEQAAGALAVVCTVSYTHIQASFLKRSFYIIFKTFLALPETRADAAWQRVHVTKCPDAVTLCPQYGVLL